VLITQNLSHPLQTYAVLFKHRIIDEKRIPIKLTQLNNLLKDAADRKSLLMSWNYRGQTEIMLLEELRGLFDAHTLRYGRGWTLSNTLQALH
jgi:hypothetical protein